ncbi:hypothetical protein G3570_01950 [Balneolaceae bacterium YR4-1]|uniref:Uncharacterized protein n=1 Tax=Halalkalibaculum roseum TaxID=2709311 RepID=A0A6M1STE0_9BACT|nr:hypothetical protein [Halalkalibaculum roseum]NGP75378.1 hypothetical protein [Halalkalibaculum roseum]
MMLIILVALLSWVLGLFLPWWSLAIPCVLLGAWLGKSGGRSFIYGFLGIALLWLIQSLFIHIGNAGVLTSRIGELLSLPDPILVIVISIIIGGLAGGMSTMTGYFFKKIFIKEEAAV